MDWPLGRDPLENDGNVDAADSSSIARSIWLVQAHVRLAACMHWRLLGPHIPELYYILSLLTGCTEFAIP
jgi:hypothetical protein